MLNSIRKEHSSFFKFDRFLHLISLSFQHSLECTIEKNLSEHDTDHMVQLEGYKVVRAEEMARIEKLSIAAGASDEGYMLKAGEAIARRIETLIKEEGWGKIVTLLVGKGNNGGDAFVAGTFLLNHGYEVKAFHLVDMKDASPLCQKRGIAFLKAGGQIGKELQLKGVIIDGLLGTGFRGNLEGKIIEVIEKVNRSKLPIVSIDIPSGLNGNTGEINPIAIKATETIFLGMPKLGFFLGKGFNYVGRLSGVDFGMEITYVREAKGNAYLVNDKGIKELLPPLERTRHKYQAGYVIAIAGSPGMPGAAMLSALAVLRTGAGIVRLFHPAGMEEELAPSAYEVIRTPYSYKDESEILKEAERAKACLVGPGIGKSAEMGAFLRSVVSKIRVPMVIDADAFYHLKSFPKGAILTPHHGEMLHLLGTDRLDHVSCQKFAEEHEVTIVLKGAPTWIFHPDKVPLIVTRGDPGMATAGTGDVLTGMIAALLAQEVHGREGATLGVYLHGVSGEIAAKKMTSYDMIASDLIAALPETFHVLMAQLPQE